MRIQTLSLAGVVIASVGLLVPDAVSQSAKNGLETLRTDSTFVYEKRDGTCLFGPLVKADQTSVIIQTSGHQVSIDRKDVVQISQGDALLYSARNSWKDVEDVHLYLHESLVFTMKNGKRYTSGQVVATDQDVKVKHGLSSVTLTKSEIANVEYKRLNPESNNFEFVREEAPYVLIFSPELYSRMFGLEGTILVRLYQSDKKEDDTNGALSCYGNKKK